MDTGDAQGALDALAGEDVRLRAARARMLDELGRVDDAAALYAALPADAPELNARERARASVEAAWQRGEREQALQALAAWVQRAPEDLLARARYAELLATTDQARARSIAGEALPLAVDAPLRRRLSAVATPASAPRAQSTN